MAVTTLGHEPRHASDTEVNTSSGFWQRLRPRRADQNTEAAAFLPDEQAHFVVEQVNAHLRGELSKAVDYLVKRQQKPPVAASPTDLDGSRPAYLLRRLALLALDLEVDPKLSFGDARKRLQWAWDMLLEREAAEAAFERHSPVNAAEAAADGALLAAAGRRGKAIGPDSQRGQVVAAEIVDRAVKAPEPTDLQLKMTPEVLARLDAGESPESVEASVTATAVIPVIESATVPASAGSPVHVPGDRVAPPIPAGDADVRVGRSLPHRYTRLTAFVARLDEHGSFVDGDPCTAEQLPELVENTGPLWLAHHGQWHRIKSAAVQGPRVHVALESGTTDCPAVGAVVHVLHDSDAKRLVRGESVEVAS